MCTSLALCVQSALLLHLISFLLCRLLPWEANAVIYRFVGSDKCMSPFIENMKKRTANGAIKAA